MPAIDRDTGLGTTYERLAVAMMLERFADRYQVRSVLEGPNDGITGIRGLNSIPLAQVGASVELLLGDPDEVTLAEKIWDGLELTDRVKIRHAPDGRLAVAPKSFDLVWSFNAIPQAREPERLIAEMCGASRRFVMIFVSNTLNYGFAIHRLHHVAAGEPWSHGDIGAMNTRMIADRLGEQGFRVIERLVVDTPWWPDIDSPIEEVAATFLPFLKRFLSASKRLDHYTWTGESLPYFQPDRRAELLREIGKHFAIERARFFPLRILFAHHRGIIAERKDGS
jgi:hypothetical protein